MDAAQHAVTLTGRDDPDADTRARFRADPAAINSLLRGRVGGDSIVASLRRLDESKYLLVSRGFRWIQERPFNR